MDVQLTPGTDAYVRVRVAQDGVARTDATVTGTLYDPAAERLVENVAMPSVGEGLYEFTCSAGYTRRNGVDVLGDYLLVVRAQRGSVARTTRIGIRVSHD